MEPDDPSKKENHKESCQAADVLNTHSVSSVVTRGPYSCSHKMEGVKKQALKIFIFGGFFMIFFTLAVRPWFHRLSSWQQSWSKLFLSTSPSPKLTPVSISSPHLCHQRYLWSHVANMIC